MNFIDIILLNLDEAANVYAQEKTVWTVNVRNFICRLQNLILNCVRDSIEELSDAEKQIYSVFKRVTAKEQEWLFKNEGGFKGVEISERLKKMSYNIRQNAKQLGLSVDSQTAAPPPSAPPVQKTTVQSFVNVKPPNLTDKNKKIYETIKTIETMLNDLKTLILEG